MVFAAFDRSNQGSSIHYGAQNLRTKKASVGTSFSSMKKGEVVLLRGHVMHGMGNKGVHVQRKNVGSHMFAPGAG